MTQEKWGQLRNKLMKAVGKNNFTTWIEPLEFQELQDGVAVFSVPTNFMGNYVSQNFADLILYELNTAGETVQRLAFKAAANSTTRPAVVTDEPKLTEVAAPVAESANAALEDLQAAPLDARFTFDSLLILVPAAWFLAGKAAAGEFDSTFFTVQVIELIAGAANLAMMGLNIRDGLRMTGKIRRPR